MLKQYITVIICRVNNRENAECKSVVEMIGKVLFYKLRPDKGMSMPD